MTKEEILNLSEAQRIEALKDVNNGLNDIEKEAVILTLNENTRRELIMNMGTELQQHQLIPLIMTLNEGTRLEMINSDKLQLNDDQKSRIILSLNENLRYEFVRDTQEGQMFQDDRYNERILLSLSLEHRKQIINESNGKYSRESLNEEHIIESLKEQDQLGGSELSGLSEESIIILKDKIGDWNLSSVVKRLSDDGIIEVLKNRNYMDSIELLLGELSEEGKIKFVENLPSEQIESCTFNSFAEETKKQILNSTKIQLEPNLKKNILIDMSADARKEALENGNLGLGSSEYKEIIFSLNEDDRKYFLENRSISLEPTDRIEVILTLSENDRQQFLETLNEEENEVWKLFGEIIDSNNNSEQFFERMSDDKHDCQIGIPKEMTIGVELESEGKYATIVMLLRSNFKKLECRI